jgi:hypothetical protein
MKYGGVEVGVMGWKQERDLLIAQTLAFVHSVTGKTNDAVASGADQQPDIDTPADAVEVEAVEIRAAEIIHAPAAPPREIQVAVPVQLDIPLPRRVVGNDVRSEMQARVASFRAHQQRFDREREEYCAATLVKLRTAIGNHPASELLSRQRPMADSAPRSFQAPATGGS